MFNILKNSNNQKISAYFCLLTTLFLILLFDVVPAVLAGLLAYTLSKNFIISLKSKIPNSKFHEKLVGLIIGISSFSLLAIIIAFIIKMLNGENISGLIITISETLNNSKRFLPTEISNYIPDSIFEIKHLLIEKAKNHFSSFADFGKNALHVFLLILIGWLIGILAACKTKPTTYTDFSKTWGNLWDKLSESFKFVVFAQVKVATFNSCIMALYLFVITPNLGWDIPYSKTLVLVTFICGLLPIIGNLISNTVSFIVSLTVSLPAAIGALLLLMVIHKFEYLIISKSLGSDIDSDIWELLIVLFAGEILFGLDGMVFSPILYAFFKKEMRLLKWLPENKI